MELYFWFSFSDGKLYDAYVIYPRNYRSSSEEAGSVEYFVHQILPDVLENQCGYNLCIYGRDLLPGEGKALCMHHMILSRKLSLLSPAFPHKWKVMGDGFKCSFHVTSLLKNPGWIPLVCELPLCTTSGHGLFISSFLVHQVHF